MKTAAHDVLHLAKRFAASLLARPLGAAEQTWVDLQLLEGERALWRRMNTADQRHAYGVASEVLVRLAADATRPVLAAALLHDVGKIESGLGTFGRSAATVLSNIGVKSGRVAIYRSHNEIGRELLRHAGSDSFTFTWAYEHELPESSWTVDHKLALVLHSADDD